MNFMWEGLEFELSGMRYHHANGEEKISHFVSLTIH